MGNFRSDDRGFSRGGSRGGFNRGGGRGGGFGGRGGGFRGRDNSFGDRERRPLEMHDVVCDKCGKNCQVPFKPTGDKPVYCSDCFEKQGSGSGSRTRNTGSNSQGMSPDQFAKINGKLDKILSILENIEFEDDGGIVDEDEESDESLDVESGQNQGQKEGLQEEKLSENSS